MSWIEIRDFEQTGLVSDIPARSLPLNAITSLTNMHLHNGKLEKLLGYETIFGTPSIAPYHMQHAVNEANESWLIYCGLNDVYTYFSNTHTKITRTLSTYAATSNNDWSSCVLGGIAVLNEGINVPQFTTGYNVQLQDLTNWPSSWTCRAMRSYREFLVALDMNEGGTDYPQLLRWSHPADPGSLPSSWDESDTTKDAGKKPFAETPGILIDCLPLGQMNIVYKSDSYYTMQYIGGQFVFSFNKVADNGLIGRNAVCEMDGRHVFLSNDDVYIHSGSRPESILHRRIRDELFSNIDNAYRSRSRVVYDRYRNEIWICIPTSGAGWLDTAYIWNVRDNTWGKRELPNLTALSVGAEVDSLLLWNSDTGTWDLDTTLWNASLAQANQLLLASADNTKIYQANYLYQAAGVDYTAEAQRVGIDFGDPNNVKFVRKVRPHFVDVSDGTQVTISIGKSDSPEGTVTWTDKTYTVGTDNEIWPMVRGRYLAWKVSMAANDTFGLESLELDVEKNGKY